MLAEWNPERQLWESGQVDLFSGQRVPFSETWPTSGMMLDGCAYELPMWEPATDASGCSYLPTPRATRGGSSTGIFDLLS